MMMRGIVTVCVALSALDLPPSAHAYRPVTAPRARRVSTRGNAPRESCMHGPLRVRMADDVTDDPLLHTLMEAARNEDVDALDAQFDNIPHATMARIQDMATQDVAEAGWLVKTMDGVMQERLAEGANKLRELLKAGEINKMDAQLVKLVRDGGVDTAFNLVLTTNMEHARAASDEKMLQLYVHLHTRMQEELEKLASPAKGLLHRLLRTDDPGLRGRILVDFLVPKTSVSMPGGKEVQLETPTPAKVSAADFGVAIRDAVAALDSVEFSADSYVSESVEECRQVAKQAREIVAGNLGEDDLVEFSEILMPAFAQHMERRAAAEADA